MTASQLTAGECSQGLTDADPGEAALVSESTEAVQLSPTASPDRQQLIREAVARLLRNTRTAAERRWSPRALYVRPARVHFKQLDDCGARRDTVILAATTDICFEGAGLLCWQQIPVRHLVLEVLGVRLACNVRWSQPLGGEFYRYGLHFYDVLDGPPCTEAAGRVRRARVGAAEE